MGWLVTQGPTDVAAPRATLRQLRDRLPQPQVMHLCKLALAEGHTIDRATGEVVAVLVASGELPDCMQLRGIVAAWCALVAAQRRASPAQVAIPPVKRRTVAVNVARDQSPEEPIELPADMVEPLTTDEQD